jgi:invasion protein IalB
MFSNGKPVTGVKVTMKLKSKKFTANTNAKGIAKFKLPKKVVKKLKVGKKYKVKFTYLTNTISKKIKVKR